MWYFTSDSMQQKNKNLKKIQLNQLGLELVQFYMSVEYYLIQLIYQPHISCSYSTTSMLLLNTNNVLFTATQNTQSQQSLPPVSYVKAIDIWMSSCSVFVFLSLMEFAVVNNYMGPIATKAMKGYSEEDIRSAVDDLKVCFSIYDSSNYSFYNYFLFFRQLYHKK